MKSILTVRENISIFEEIGLLFLDDGDSTLCFSAAAFRIAMNDPEKAKQFALDWPTFFEFILDPIKAEMRMENARVTFAEG
jgi:hypothetical protein